MTRRGTYLWEESFEAKGVTLCGQGGVPKGDVDATRGTFLWEGREDCREVLSGETRSDPGSSGRGIYGTSKGG